MAISVHITITIDPKDREKFFATFLELFEKTTALPECTLFEVYESAETPGEFSWVENWSISVEEVMVILQQDDHKPLLEFLKGLLIKPQITKVYNRLGEPYTMTRKANGGVRD